MISLPLAGESPAALDAAEIAALSAEVREAAREVFGPARYHPFTMPA